MAKPKILQIPTDPLSGEVLSDGRIQSSILDPVTKRYINNPSYGMAVKYVDTFVFHAKMQIKSMSSSYSGSPRILLEDLSNGFLYRIFSNEFNEVVTYIKDGGIIEADWTFCKKGSKISVRAIV